MPQLAYAERSRFIAPVLAALRDHGAGHWTVQLSEALDGYGGCVEVTLPGDSPRTFGTDWAGADPTRFPARLRAAATALRDAGLSGRFRLTHRAGTLTLEHL